MIQRKRFLFRLLAAAMVLLCVAAPLEQVRAVGAAAYIPGDIDGNFVVNRDDVVQLLLHVSMPDAFPIAVPADYTGDGNISREDVVQLLLHVSMPDAFPLA